MWWEHLFTVINHRSSIFLSRLYILITALYILNITMLCNSPLANAICFTCKTLNKVYLILSCCWRSWSSCSVTDWNCTQQVILLYGTPANLSKLSVRILFSCFQVMNVAKLLFTFKSSNGKSFYQNLVTAGCDIVFLVMWVYSIITHAPVHINDFRGVRARYVKRTG